MKASSSLPKRKGIPLSGSSVKPFTIVAIGASAGGLEAITQLLQNLSSDTGMAYIYVQHLSPDHKSMLTELLSKKTGMKVHEVENMEQMKPNRVYVIPYDKEIEVTNGHIRLIPRPKNKPTNLSIDVLFSSLALTHGANVIGIILSGNGSDGTRGLKEIKLAGGITFAQDDSAKSTSMPRSAVAEGVVDFVLSPKEMAKEIMLLSKHSGNSGKPVKTSAEEGIHMDDPDLKGILQQLHKRKNVDFSYYKLNTIRRRIWRRMLIQKAGTVKQYAALIAKKNNELDLLYRDLLINVTDFFRDPDAFMVLKKTVLPRLLNGKPAGETLRLWVAACATGEEVYSLAILLIELQDSKTNNIPFQIFASDLSAEAIRDARKGEYTAQQLSGMSPKRLQRFFTKVKDKYRVSQHLRDVCIFAQHNILSDPPFSRMDFISCRNFLIYLEQAAQKKAITTFHYALREGGCLMLGKSETIGTLTRLFSPLNKTYKIYHRKNHSAANRIPEPLTPVLQPKTKSKIAAAHPLPGLAHQAGKNTLGMTFDALLLDRYVPASVIINTEMDILQFRGDTEKYLKQSSGKASFNILKMVKPEMTFELRNAIHHAVKSRNAVSKEGIELNREAGSKTIQLVNLEVIPLPGGDEDPLFMVIFTGQHIDLPESSLKGNKIKTAARDRRIKKLEDELSAARHDMSSITRDQESANEELQSANEEAVSSNEELQSLNEELETSKEEIESTNEELITTNQELQNRIQEVEELYAYYEGILSTIQEPMLILDKFLRVKSVNTSFCKMFRVSVEESQGVLLYKLGADQWNIPRLRELLEEIVPKNKRFHGFEVSHDFPLIGFKTMLLNAHRIIQHHKNEELIVLTITDITEVNRLALELQMKEKRVLEVELDAERSMKLKVEESNKALQEAKIFADAKTRIAEQAVQSKQHFLSNMSHEIRTPMNAIVGFTNVLLKGAVLPGQKEFLHSIKTSAGALTVLINDILDLAKVDAGKMVFEKRAFRMRDSIQSVFHLFESSIQNKGLVFTKNVDAAIPSVVVGDPVRLHQIMLNLISNAEKFTADGSIAVSIALLRELADSVTLEFSIADTGIGIEENKLEHIFKNFEQASGGTSRLYGGTGLGLAIVKQLVEGQGGSLRVQSKPGAGSTFSFNLSYDKTEAHPEEEIPVSRLTSEVNNIHVLMVEDIALNQLLLKTLLDEFGFTYDCASNGKIAIELMEQHSYDIVLMDLHMPVMNGFEATAYIRQTLQSTVPIIVLTADVTTMDLEKCKALGMDDYISKPIDDQLLYSKIKSLVSKKTN
jgi:two-component system CheB/CheR fusion protein